MTDPSRPSSALEAARTALRLLRLRLTLPLLFRRESLPGLLARLDAARGAPGGAGELAAAVERCFRPLRLWPTTCLWRALGGYAALRAAGADVRFLIGVRRKGDEPAAHAWLERDGSPSLGAPPAGDGWVVAFAWPADEGVLHPEVRRATGLVPARDAVLTELRDGTGVLLHLARKLYFTLNRTGVVAWKLLADGGVDGAPELAVRLAALFPEADPAVVRVDVVALVDELLREELVLRVGDGRVAGPATATRAR